MFDIKAKNIVFSIIKWISTVGVILVVIFAMLVVGVKLLGWDVYVVLSGSMEPAIPTGSIIYTKDPNIEELGPGDIITFQMTGGKVATHRIDSIEGSGADLAYITKGDANDNVDANPVAPGNVIGQFVGVVPYAGYIINYVQSPMGIFVSIAVIAGLLILMLLPDIFLSEDDKKKKSGEQTEVIETEGEELPEGETVAPVEEAEAAADADNEGKDQSDGNGALSE